MDIKIIVASHKKYDMPDKKIYIPLHVGKNGKPEIGYVGDDTGDNISHRNSYLNEMTGVYWAWRNLKADYVGVVHYRRYFSNAPFIKRIFCHDRLKLVVDEKELCKKLIKNDIILPKKRRYYIESLESHFRHLPYAVVEDLDLLRKIIKEEYPDYLNAFELVMKRSWGHMFNMFIMKRCYFEEYCEWAFPILLKIDACIQHEKRTRIQDRAYISEFLMDVWIETKQYSYAEMSVLHIEKEHIVRKIGVLLYRKFFN